MKGSAKQLEPKPAALYTKPPIEPQPPNFNSANVFFFITLKYEVVRFSCLKLKISIITEPTGFSVYVKLQIRSYED